MKTQLRLYYSYVLSHLPLRITLMRKEQMFHVDCFASFLKHVCNDLLNTNLILNLFLKLFACFLMDLVS